MASSVHECTFSLEILNHGRYLTGLYLCTQCGAHKSVQVSMQVSESLLWQQRLRKIIAESELHLQKLRNEIRPTSLEEKVIANSLEHLEKTVALFRRTLKQIERSAEQLAEVNMYPLDRHDPSRYHLTSKKQAESPIKDYHSSSLHLFSEHFDCP